MTDYMIGRGGEIHRGVLIDPEDAEQVDRLLGLWANQEAPSYGRRSLVAALREFATPTPPKPDEPRGLGAVVEDDRGHRFVRRCSCGAQTDWMVANSTDRTGYNYAAIDAVRVLSEGVTP